MTLHCGEAMLTLLPAQMARMVATKAALSIRLDALADAEAEPTPSIGLDSRVKLEARLRGLETRSDVQGLRSGAGAGAKQSAYSAGTARGYNAAADAPATPAKSTVPDVSAMDVDSPAPAAKEMSKEEKKAAKKARKSMEAAAAPASVASASVPPESEAESKLSKEERKALKKAAKAAAAAASSGESRTIARPAPCPLGSP
jgi:nucleolar protein 58